MPPKTLRELRDGESFEGVFLASGKQVRSNKNGQPYLQVDLCDRSGPMTARLWNCDEKRAKSFEDGEFVRAKARAQLFQGAMQLILTDIEKAPEGSFNPADFLPRTEMDVSRLLERLRGLIRSMDSHHLRALGEAFLMDGDLIEGFCRAPAGIRQHHAYIGGLLEHVVNMMEVSDRVSPLYPGLNRDLLLCGCLLHDMGKVRELSYQASFGYTDEGQLVGHISLGAIMLEGLLAKAAELTGEPFPSELRLRIHHLIASHHGTLEFGSPKVPMTPEAQALHLIDMLDSKMHQFLREIRAHQTDPGAWTPFDNSLGRKFFKGSAPPAN